MSTQDSTLKNSLFIMPGAWRPHYPWEQIAWIHPPWGNDDFVWLDFPEALFCDQGLLYLSHVNHDFPATFSTLPPVSWQAADGEITYTRRLPNDVALSGTLTVHSPQTVALSLTIANHSVQTLTTVRLQTCLFMRAHHLLAAQTLNNKYIHSASAGWINLTTASDAGQPRGQYRIGWRGGPPVADLPVIACTTPSDDRAIAFSWGSDTYSLIANPDHPCIHADPAVPDLAPGASYQLTGEIYFAEHGLAEIADRYQGSNA